MNIANLEIDMIHESQVLQRLIALDLEHAGEVALFFKQNEENFKNVEEQLFSLGFYQLKELLKKSEKLKDSPYCTGGNFDYKTIAASFHATINAVYQQKIQQILQEFPLEKIQAIFSDINNLLQQEDRQKLFLKLFDLQMIFQDMSEFIGGGHALATSKEIRDFNPEDAIQLLRELYPKIGADFSGNKFGAIILESLQGRSMRASENEFDVFFYNQLVTSMKVFAGISLIDYNSIVLDEDDWTLIEDFTSNHNMQMELIQILVGLYPLDKINEKVEQIIPENFRDAFKVQLHKYLIENANQICANQVQQFKEAHPVDVIPQTYQGYISVVHSEKAAENYDETSGEELKQFDKKMYDRKVEKKTITLETTKQHQERTQKNRIARQFIQLVKANIETTNWKVSGIWGGVSVEGLKSDRLPSNVAAIYGLCKQAETSGSYVEKFNEIALIGKKAAAKSPFWGKRDGATQAFYTSFEKALDNIEGGNKLIS